MGVGTAIRQGLSMARRTRSAVWVLFLVNLGLAALAALPIYQGILRITGHSLMSQELAQAFSLDWLTDFVFNNPGSFDRYARLIAYAGLVTMPVNALLAGGVLARFREPDQPSSLGMFFRDTARYGWRLIRLMILGLIAYWVVFILINQKLGDWVGKLTRDARDDRVGFVAHLTIVVLVLLGLAFVNLVMDYARVKLVLDDGPSVIEAFLASLGFSLGRLRKAFTVYALPALGGVALLGLYRLLLPWGMFNAAARAASPYREPLMLALLFILQQLVMFGRYWFRVATWASEWSYYAGSRHAAPPAAPAA